jgi:mono/diheme cytochrome c family protein
LEVISAESDRGKAEFERICSGCHGKEGIGEVGPRLVPFTKSNRELLAIVREGSGQMPAISVTDISDENVAAVAEYLRQLTVASQRGAWPESTQLARPALNTSAVDHRFTVTVYGLPD